MVSCYFSCYWSIISKICTCLCHCFSHLFWDFANLSHLLNVHAYFSIVYHTILHSMSRFLVNFPPAPCVLLIYCYTTFNITKAFPKVNMPVVRPFVCLGCFPSLHNPTTNSSFFFHLPLYFSTLFSSVNYASSFLNIFERPLHHQRLQTILLIGCRRHISVRAQGDFSG